MQFRLQFCDDDQVISIRVFPGTSCTGLLGKVPWGTVGGSGMSLGGLFHTKFFAQFTTVEHQPLLDDRVAENMIHLGMQSNAFSRKTNAMYSVLLMARNFSYNWHTIKMASVVLHPGMKPNCMSSMCTCNQENALPSTLVPSWPFHGLEFCERVFPRSLQSHCRFMSSLRWMYLGTLIKSLVPEVTGSRNESYFSYGINVGFEVID